jgi:NADPH-dependent glutamate synthase beta subunit-like oxidoreductase
VPGRDLDGVHFAMEFLPQQNKVNAGDKLKGQIMATGKHVIVIGGGDTGSDCVGTSNRHGAASVTQFELMPQPPEQENKPLTWPYWPIKLRTSSSHEEGCEREFAIATKEFIGSKGKVTALKTVQREWQGGKMSEVPGSEKEYKADLVLLAMGFVARWPACWTPSASRRTHAATPRPHTEARAATAPTSTRSSPPATCAAASPGGVGHPRGPPGRTRGGRVPDGQPARCRADRGHRRVTGALTRPTPAP